MLWIIIDSIGTLSHSSTCACTFHACKHSKTSLTRLTGFCIFLQEPGTAEDIKAFARRYSAGFELFSKIDVNGQNAHPVYKFLKSRLRGSMGKYVPAFLIKFRAHSKPLVMSGHIATAKYCMLQPSYCIIPQPSTTCSFFNRALVRQW